MQARNLTTNVPKILDLKSSSEELFSKNCRWVTPTLPVLGVQIVGNSAKRYEHKKTTMSGWGSRESPLFLLIFFSLSSFALRSSIRTAGTG